MELFERFSEHPVAMAAAAVFAAVLLVAMRAQQLVRARAGTVPGLDEMMSSGRYAEAAGLCMQHERYADAQELYLRAQQPARAAQVAVRLGDMRAAGELYERAGDTRRAAQCFERAGMAAKARELLAPAPPAAAPAQAASVAPPRAGEARVMRPPALCTPEPMPAPTAEARFRALLARGASDDAARFELQDVAQQAAEEALAAGDIRKAAEIYRDGGIDDEAIHLYASVLGQPGDAAVLLSARGQHERAAELFEQAGQRERAAAAWADVARKDGRVERWVDRIEGLDRAVALAVLEESAATRPASRDTAEVHYRLGRMLETTGDRGRALEVLASLQRAVGGYRDVDALVVRLRGDRASVRATPAVTPRSSAPAPRSASLATTTVVLQTIQVTGDMKPEAVQALAREAARSVSGEAAPNLLADPEVRAAREGPTMETLRRFVGDAPCDLSNIEVYHRMGLAALAAGDWSTALKHFEAVEGASPGYREADRRAEEIRTWQRSTGAKISAASAALGEGGSRYVLQGELGRGGMAVVYRAMDTVLGREVALKFPNEGPQARKEFREMFLREARSIAQLNHPNIVTIYDVGTLDGRAFISMEFVEGTTVDAAVERQRRLPVAEALRIAAQVLAALDYAHGRQIIHRDVKPSNMMRAPSGVVKLMDFGLAKTMSNAAKVSIVAGTPAYMPPEQASGKNVDHRADLFAVGASLFEMVTGELPFAGHAQAVAAPSARALERTVPEGLDEALRVALDADPAKRFASARDFAERLQRVLASLDAAAAERVEATPAREARPLAVTAPTRPQSAPLRVVEAREAPKRPDMRQTMTMVAPDEVAPRKKSTLLMHAGDSEAPPRPASSASRVSSASVSSVPGPSRKATMLMNSHPSEAPPHSRSTLPPPA